MIGQFKVHTNDRNLAYFTKMRAGKKRRVLLHPEYSIGNRPHTAKFKVVRNVRLFTSYPIDSNLQDKIAGQHGIRKWTFCKFDGRRSSGNYLQSTIRIPSKLNRL